MRALWAAGALLLLADYSHILPELSLSIGLDLWSMGYATFA